MKRILASCLGFGVLVAAQGAGAADLSLAPLYKAPPARYAPTYSWSGFYLGLNGGGGWGHSWWRDARSGIDLSGGLIGGTAGYNWQFGQTVLGVEGDIDWAGLKGSSTSAACPGGSCSTSDTWLSTVRGRLGYSFGSVLPYVTGGLATGDIKASAPGLPGASATNSGWTIGGGFEFALPGNWSAKAEYLHVDLGSFNCGAACGAAQQNASLHDDVFRAGVNYHFGWGK